MKTNVEQIGEYEVISKIAEGGMGAVYKARRPSDGLLVAIKVLPAHLAKNRVLLARFEKEYNASRLLQHPNIVRALAFGKIGPSPYLVMEFVDGETLGDWLERDKRLSEAQAIPLISQVAVGLHKAHNHGLVHRDVKPDNILIDRDGVAKLTDLGLVKHSEAEINLTRTGRGLGTPHFMAPEQFRNAKGADVRCDIYSLAATLYMMVTGELPFKSLGPLEAWMKKIENNLKPPREVWPALSERVDWAIRRAMHADPDVRPNNCHEFIEDLTGQSTRKLPYIPENPSKDLWHMRYRDDDGVLHNVSASLASIRHSLKLGHLGDASNIRASRDPDQPFKPLRGLPEFRDVVLAPVVKDPARSTPTENLPTKPKTPANLPRIGPQPKSLPKTRPLPSLAPHKPEPIEAPSISLGTSTQSTPSDWVTLVVLVGLAVLAGASGYFLILFWQHLMRF